MHRLIDLFLWLPVIGAVVFNGFIVVGMYFFPSLALNSNALLIFFLICLGVGILQLLASGVYVIARAWKLKQKPFVTLHRLYRDHRRPIAISLAVTITEAVLLFGLLLPLLAFPIFSAAEGPGLILVIKFILICLALLIPYYLPLNRVTAVGLAMVFIGVSAVVGLFIFGIASEFAPHYYNTFRLDDPRGEYVLNYDGDYWLTYYVDGKNVGNTSITETPVELAPYVGKPLRITGEFMPIQSSLGENGKQLCVGVGIRKHCNVSTGPGVWHASPLKIQTIEVVKK